VLAGLGHRVLLVGTGNTKHRPTQKNVPSRVGETTSLTIQGRKGEDISHQNHINAGQRLRIPGEAGECPVPGQPVWQPSSSAVVPFAVVRSVTTLSIRVADPVKRKSARPTSEPSAAWERRVQ